ncbi:hypothetical protein GCM10009789_84810 [Kribbella sancticallisti]|uniref:Tat pathway signal sequence domain protein n=1 Tax=Kribbella sancticallisti TaxID=460087 RepID=A0ABP4QU79_9ACTN
MNGQLKDLMDQASDRLDRFVPDIEDLLAASRRRVRRRRLASAVAVLAAVAIVATGTTVALDLTEAIEPPVSTEPTNPSAPNKTPGPAQNRNSGCTRSNGTGDNNGWAWPAVLFVDDQYGSAAVRQSPKDRTVVFCVTQTVKWSAYSSVVLGGSAQGILLRKTPAGVTRDEVSPRASVTTVFGLVRSGIPRVTVETEDGHVGQATVANGYFVYRRHVPTPWPGPEPHVKVRFKYAGEDEYLAANR